MTKDGARRLIAKLEALADPTRGGTPAECALAGEKARELRARFRILEASPEPEAPRRFTGRRRGASFFDPRTGAHSSDVLVHHYRGRRDWKIEIPPEPPRKGFTG